MLSLSKFGGGLSLLLVPHMSPPDLVFSVVEETDPNENDETNEINESRQGEPGLGSGDGRWIQPPRND